MADSPYKYKQGDRVVIGPNTLWASDRQYLGRKGVIEGDPWRNGGYTKSTGNCYRVVFSDGIAEGGDHNFFEEDLTPDGIDSQIALLKAELAKLEKEKAKEGKVTLPKDLLVASSIYFAPNQLVIKVAKEKWHWYYIDTKEMQFHSTSDDHSVSIEIATAIDHDIHYEVHRPTDL